MVVAQSANDLLRWQFQLAHRLLGASVEGLSPAAAVCHARAVLCLDLIVNGVLAARKPLAVSTWRGRTGLSELPPLCAPIDWRTWAARVRLDRADFLAYAGAVYAATDAYLARDHPESTTCLLSALLITVSMRRGQIASV